MGNTCPEYLLRGLKFLGENLRGLKWISKFDQILFKISINIEGLIYCSKTPAATSLYNNDAQIWFVSGLKILVK